MKSKGMWAFYPPQYEQLCNTLVGFMDRNVRVAIQLDSNYVENPRQFIQYFDNRIKEFMNINNEENEILNIYKPARIQSSSEM